MVVRNVKYEDFNGVEKEKKLYFNLTKTELQKLELSTEGGLKDTVEEIVKSKDNVKIYELFEKIVHASYGVKSDDGERFMKSPQILDDFIHSAVYDEFLYDLFDAKKSSDFISELIKGALKNVKGVDVDKVLADARAQANAEASNISPVNN